MRKLLSTSAALATLAVSMTVSASAAPVPTAVSRPAAQIVRPKPLSIGNPPQYYFGGATLPGPAYAGPNALLSNDPTLAARSYFGYFAGKLRGVSGTTASYCLTGSGFGRTILESGTGASLPCAAGTPVSGTNGFAAASGDNVADAAGSDAPLAQSDYDAWATASRSGELVQIPAVVGAIALVANEDNGPTTLQLSETTICKIYDGEITQWKDVPGYLNTDTNTIKLVIRGDSSGTSFSFSNYLANVCGLRGGSMTARYSAESQFNPTALPSPLSSPLSTPTFVSETGNPAVFGEVNSVNNSHELAYVEDGYLVDAASAGITLKSDIRIAQVETHASGGGGTGSFAGPLAVTITAANIPAAAWNTDKVISTGVNTLPSLVTIGSHAPSTPGCNVVADPTQYGAVAASGAYPIIAISYLDFASSGNGMQGAADLKQLALLGVDLSTSFTSAGNNYGGLSGVNTINKASSSAGTTGYSSIFSTSTSTAPDTLINGSGVGANCIVP